jgi:amidase
MPLFLPLAQHFSQFCSFDWFTYVVIHAGLQAPLTVAWHSVGGHSNNRRVTPGHGFSLPDGCGGSIAVHLRHLTVHKDQGIGHTRQYFDRFTTADHSINAVSWDVTCVPGGSSGGSAAALAAGLTGLEAGSDIGASIRNPSHYCGVYGHKPTYGIVSPRGQAPPGKVSVSDISVIGPMARSAEDLALGLTAMAGPDDIDARGWQLRLPQPTKKALRDYKIAVVYTDAEADVDAAVQDRLHAVVDCLVHNQVQVSDTARPKIDSRTAHRNYIQLLRAATSGSLTPAIFEKNVRAATALQPSDEGYEAQMLRAQAMYHKDWHAWNEARHHMRLAWADFFREYDLLLCPAATTVAFAHNQHGERWERMLMVNGQPQPSTTQMFWAGYSGNFYLPSTVAPAGLSREGLPVGVQIVGPQYGDYTCIHFARLLEREFYRFTPPPGYEVFCT